MIPKMETNMYGYVLQDSVNFNDPSGLMSDYYRQRGAKFSAWGTGIGTVGGLCFGAGWGSIPLGALFLEAPDILLEQLLEFLLILKII